MMHVINPTLEYLIHVFLIKILLKNHDLLHAFCRLIDSWEGVFIK